MTLFKATILERQKLLNFVIGSICGMDRQTANMGLESWSKNHGGISGT